MAQTFGEFRPTAFDGPGNYIGDPLTKRRNWLVAPVSINRDTTDATEKSNWRMVQKILKEARVRFEIHRFGHWGHGWYEIILVSPHKKGPQVLYEIEGALANYPILDEEDNSRQEMENADEDWDNWGESEFTRELERTAESAMVENWDNHEPMYVDQRWCQHWGMDVDLCQCGDCITTVRQYYQHLNERVSDLNDKERAYLKQELVTSEAVSGGTSFMWDKDLTADQIAELLEAFDEQEQTCDSVDTPIH